MVQITPISEPRRGLKFDLAPMLPFMAPVSLSGKSQVPIPRTPAADNERRFADSIRQFCKAQNSEEASRLLDVVGLRMLDVLGISDSEQGKGLMPMQKGFPLIKDSAYALGGEQAETLVSRGLADTLAACIIGSVSDPARLLRLSALAVCISSTKGVPFSAFAQKAAPQMFGNIGAELYEANRTATSENVVFEPHWFEPVWPKPCQTLFEYFAERYPAALPVWLQNEELSAGLRARAADAVRGVQDSAMARSLLLPLTEDAPPLVGEAAIYSLACHINDEVETRLKQLASKSGTHQILVNAVENLLDVA